MKASFCVLGAVSSGFAFPIASPRTAGLQRHVGHHARRPEGQGASSIRRHRILSADASGAAEMIGPASASQNYEYGILIEGHDRPHGYLLAYQPQL